LIVLEIFKPRWQSGGVFYFGKDGVSPSQNEGRKKLCSLVPLLFNFLIKE